MSEAAADGDWREQAISRSLDTARTRAEERVQRFLDAAMELVVESNGIDFTVQDVVERSEQSLRSFYQFFGSKHHLLLALLQEGLQSSADNLRAELDGIDDAEAQLHTLVTTLYEWCERVPADEPPTPHRVVRNMAEFAFQLVNSHPDQAATASAPLLTLTVEVLDATQGAGVTRPGNTTAQAALLLQTVMFNAFSSPFGGTSKAHRSRAEHMWAFCFSGLAT